ncbi:MAG: ABC transporter permease, partial [Deinococcus sp.]|nr:ABC transporter permease [Deinococcus sp.]
RAGRRTWRALAVDLALMLPSLGFIVLFFGYPLVLNVLRSIGLAPFTGVPRYTLEHYQRLLNARLYHDSAVFTVWVAVGTTLVSLVIAIPLSVVVRYSFPGKALYMALSKVPLMIPGVVVIFLFFAIAGRGALLTQLFERIGWTLPNLVHDRGGWGVIIAQAWGDVPFMVLIISSVMVSISSDLVEAARNLGASGWRVLWHVLIPMALPGITAATLLEFVRVFGAYAIPAAVGPIYPTPLPALLQREAFDRGHWEMAAAIANVMVVPSAVVLILYYLGFKRREGLGRR